jgi:preprotein translocase subunit SecB
MKKSPLQLNWVVYPVASYEYLDTPESEDGRTAVDIDAEVTWDIDGQHTASIAIKNRDDGTSPYRFNVIAAALFTFDLDIATEFYKPGKPQSLASIIAVNICRIVFSGAREQISMMTARGPVGPLMIESVVVEPSDIKISSTVEPQKILQKVFNVSNDAIKKIEARANELAADEAADKKGSKRAHKKES